MPYLNISAYRFVTIDPTELPALRLALFNKAQALAIKGTVLLATEGINLSLVGLPEAIAEWQAYLNEWPALRDLWCKSSWSEALPFQRLKIKIKPEIITLRQPSVDPAKKTADYVTPDTLRAWYQAGRDMVVLDTRNDYEVAAGTFEQATTLNLAHFRHFPEAVNELPEAFKNKPVVTFCTGGIRCEKAAAFLLEQGFQEVYQLEGGIINYFAACGGDYYNGNCYVFDDRGSVTPELTASPYPHPHDPIAV